MINIAASVNNIFMENVKETSAKSRGLEIIKYIAIFTFGGVGYAFIEVFPRVHALVYGADGRRMYADFLFFEQCLSQSADYT